MKLRMARFGDVFQDVPSLLATGGGRCQDALREAAAFRALRAETHLAPQYALARRALGRVVGRVHGFGHNA